MNFPCLTQPAMNSLLVLPSIPPTPSCAISTAQNRHHYHVLSERVYIPSEIYTHPAALLLESCASLPQLRRILPQIIKHGLYAQHLFQTKLISLFSKHGSMTEAGRVFESVEDGDRLDVLYHTMLKGYVKSSSLRDSLSFFVRMKRDEVRHVVYNFIYLLKAYGDEANLKRGKEIHGQLVVNGFSGNLFAMTGVVNMYAKCREIHEARKMFDRMPERDLVSWNTIVSGYAQNGLTSEAFSLVGRMQVEERHRPDSITAVAILPAVADSGLLMVGKSVHGYAIRAGLDNLVNVSTALLDMYAKCKAVGVARAIFDKMVEKTVVSWNSMIDGYVQNENSEEAIKIFRKMLDEGVDPTNVTVMGALAACADTGHLEMGMFTHELLTKMKLDSDVSVMNSLISMYSKCKKVDVAAGIFSQLKQQSLVSWNAMILGFAQNGRVSEALNLFCQMLSENLKPDTFTMVSVMPALAELSVTRQAKWIHGLVIRYCMDSNLYVMTALIDMYAKCGALGTARKLFDSMKDRHVITWNAMIDGYGTHGHGRAAVELFRDMRNGTEMPNGITFLCVLSACSHSGLVEEGLRFHDMMKEDYGIKPSMDHCGSVVDLLGRAGRLKEAWNFIQKMPFEPGITVYGAMLGACKIHKNVELGEMAADKLFQLNPQEGGYHVLLSNIYATASMWDKVAVVRGLMQKERLQKTPGCSLVELRNEVHTFYSGTTDHPQSKRIYAFLETLVDEIKAAGYVPETHSIHDVEDHVKEHLLNSHSERLAIAFGLLNTSPGTTIHVRKNLRVCGDCHNATKYISLVTRREIVVRDMHRFHHFKNGVCSCGDYW